jgi:hypothetical protein
MVMRPSMRCHRRPKILARPSPRSGKPADEANAIDLFPSQSDGSSQPGKWSDHLTLLRHCAKFGATPKPGGTREEFT